MQDHYGAVGDGNHIQRDSARATHQFSFTGSGGEYFRIWIVNILLTIVTLYIYSAWAKVRSKRYFYGNTALSGSSFEYHAKGIQLLPGRLIGLAFVVVLVLAEYLPIFLVSGAYIFIMLLAPWAMCQSRKFNARMSSYRNVRFGFNGRSIQYYKYLMFIPLAVIVGIAVVVGLVAASVFGSGAMVLAAVAGVLVFYFSWPWIQAALSEYTINQTSYGQTAFEAELEPRRFYFVYLLAILIFLAVGGIFAGVIFLLAKAGNLQVILSQSAAEIAEEGPILYLAIALMYLLVIVAGYVAGAFFSAKIRNYQFAQTTVGKRFQLQSSAKVWPLLKLRLGNLLLLIVTLGLAYPWVAVRMARFWADNTQVIGDEDIDQFVSLAQNQSSAMGEELGDALDLDFSAGI